MAIQYTPSNHPLEGKSRPSRHERTYHHTIEPPLTRAKLSFPMSRHRTATYAWEFVTSIYGYEDLPWNVGKALTAKLLEFLRHR